MNIKRSLPAVDEFCSKYNLTTNRRNLALSEWEGLREIFRAYCERHDELHATGSSIAERLRLMPAVHSLKFRVKDPEHLVEKIIRKRVESPEESISLGNYDGAITDLIGVRVLHLFKDDWLSIHQFVTGNWELDEKLAYVREGDPPELLDKFRGAGLEVKNHPQGYRSIHYVVRSQPTKQIYRIELQVRTIFEEGWSEIDHRIRYPYFMDDPVLTQFLVLFNRAAGNADEMGTFIKDLAVSRQRQRNEQEEKERALKETISKLEIEKGKKQQLEEQLKDLTSVRTERIRHDSIWFGGEGKMTSGVNIRNSSSLLMPPIPLRTCITCGESFTPDFILSVLEVCPKCRSNMFVK